MENRKIINREVVKAFDEKIDTLHCDINLVCESLAQCETIEPNNEETFRVMVDIVCLKALDAVFGNTLSFAENVVDFFNTLVSAYEKDIEDLQNENALMLQKMNNAKVKFKEQSLKIEKLEEQLKEKESLVNYDDVEIKNLVNRIDGLLSLVENNADSIANSAGIRKKMIEHRRGEQSLAFKSDVNTAELVEAYQMAGCKLSQEVLNKFPSMTWQGLKKRLQSVGAWKQK